MKEVENKTPPIIEATSTGLYPNLSPTKPATGAAMKENTGLRPRMRLISVNVRPKVRA